MSGLTTKPIEELVRSKVSPHLSLQRNPDTKAYMWVFNNGQLVKAFDMRVHRLRQLNQTEWLAGASELMRRVKHTLAVKASREKKKSFMLRS